MLTWQLTARPAATNAAALDEVELKRRFGPDAQMLSSPQVEQEGKLYFADLPGDLQRVLQVQLRQAGDVSAVSRVEQDGTCANCGRIVPAEAQL